MRKSFMKKIMAILLAATMMMAMGVSVFAAENNTANYTSASLYYNGEPAPHGMDTGCFDSVSTDGSGNTVITLKSYTYLIATGNIESCVTMDGTELVSTDGSSIVIPSSLGSSIDVSVTFGGSLATLISWGVIPMSNPMSCTIVLS